MPKTEAEVGAPGGGLEGRTQTARAAPRRGALVRWVTAINSGRAHCVRLWYSPAAECSRGQLPRDPWCSRESMRLGLEIPRCCGRVPHPRLHRRPCRFTPWCSQSPFLYSRRPSSLPTSPLPSTHPAPPLCCSYQYTFRMREGSKRDPLLVAACAAPPPRVSCHSVVTPPPPPSLGPLRDLGICSPLLVLHADGPPACATLLLER